MIIKTLIIKHDKQLFITKYKQTYNPINVNINIIQLAYFFVWGFSLSLSFFGNFGVHYKLHIKCRTPFSTVKCGEGQGSMMYLWCYSLWLDINTISSYFIYVFILSTECILSNIQSYRLQLALTIFYKYISTIQNIKAHLRIYVHIITVLFSAIPW